jgi:Flp pilus assembly CpaF family ATPase
VYVERSGRLELTDVTFHDNAHLMKIIEKIVSRVGRGGRIESRWWMRACRTARA